MTQMQLPINRSIPRCTVIPEFAYADIGEAINWLCEAFGFTLRIRIGDHRAQLNVGDGAVVLTELKTNAGSESAGGGSPQVDTAHSVMVRVADVDSHHDHAIRHGARVVREPASYPYGERQYSVEDLGGHRWTFTQSIADVAPEDWGGTAGHL
jgi:uncharacterized glyoxalase superfamily protein PhnB